jgi:hypothetical protein
MSSRFRFLYDNNFSHTTLKGILFCTLMFISVFFTYGQGKKRPLAFKRTYPEVIHKLSELNLPKHVMAQVRSFSLEDLQTGNWNLDYHENIIESDREYVIKVMLRFFNGNIVGFIKKVPIDNKESGEYYQTEVNVPMNWCAKDSLKQEHCITTSEDLAILDKVSTRDDFYQKLDEGELTEKLVNNNTALLAMLETKKGRKRIRGKELSDSVNRVLENLTGGDSEYYALKFDELKKESIVKSKKTKPVEVLNDDIIDELTGLKPVKRKTNKKQDNTDLLAKKSDKKEVNSVENETKIARADIPEKVAASSKSAKTVKVEKKGKKDKKAKNLPADKDETEETVADTTNPFAPASTSNNDKKDSTIVAQKNIMDSPNK